MKEARWTQAVPPALPVPACPREVWDPQGVTRRVKTKLSWLVLEHVRYKKNMSEQAACSNKQTIMNTWCCMCAASIEHQAGTITLAKRVRDASNLPQWHTISYDTSLYYSPRAMPSSALLSKTLLFCTGYGIPYYPIRSRNNTMEDADHSNIFQVSPRYLGFGSQVQQVQRQQRFLQRLLGVQRPAVQPSEPPGLGGVGEARRVGGRLLHLGGVHQEETLLAFGGRGEWLGGIQNRKPMLAINVGHEKLEYGKLRCYQYH